ncbi:antitermination protein [Yersinia ruckeri]|nr:antitermination protein [Yersinia ruckeri]MCW6595697.1 antitermination protein [Yersinia ruckeri]UIN13032.1 antitermination protein [Yersinia ruckeri]UIN16411.1 antitermination protein [Yersinia ruckeri]
MELESAIKQFSPKSQMITDAPRATSSTSLTGPDIAAAMGMAESRAGFGMAAYMGKLGISKEDKIRTIEQLTQYAKQQAPKHVGKAAGKRLAQCMVILAKFAYAEYSNSAASVTICASCDGRGLVDEVKTYKNQMAVDRKEWLDNLPNGLGLFYASEPISRKEGQEIIQTLCKSCNGKGVISLRCRCNGTGKVRDLEKSKQLGAPVEKECERCSGIGYKRTPSTTAYRAITALLTELNERTWRRNWKPFYESLVAKCDIEESYAEDEFQRITR